MAVFMLFAIIINLYSPLIKYRSKERESGRAKHCLVEQNLRKSSLFLAQVNIYVPIISYLLQSWFVAFISISVFSWKEYVKEWIMIYAWFRFSITQLKRCCKNSPSFLVFSTSIYKKLFSPNVALLVILCGYCNLIGADR